MRTHLPAAFVAVSVLFASLIACGGGDTPPPVTPPAHEMVADAGGPPTPAPTAATADAGAAPVATTAGGVVGPSFDALPREKQVEIMSSKVVPTLGKDFKEFDGKRFASFGCATCHGKPHQDVHKILPKLTMSNGGFEKMQKKHPEMVKFMSEKVVPDMAAALGEKPMDPTTHQGFGCGGCHELK